MNTMKPKETVQEHPDTSIRKATIEDIPEMARINVECRKNNYKGIVAQDVLDAMSVEERIGRWTENFEEMQKNKVLYCKEIDGKIVGFIGWGINDDPKFPYENEIKMLYVDINQQGKKIGKELFEKILEDEIFKNCTSFCVWTLRDNPQSNHFYQKMWGKQFSYKASKHWTMLVGYYRQK